jgi:antitoxin MazE
MIEISTTIEKWGNSLGVRLPKAVLERSDIKNGTRVSFDVKDKKIILERLPDKVSKRKLTLKQVMASIDPKVIRSSFVDFGHDVGGEIVD